MIEIALKDVILAIGAVNLVGILATYIDKKNARFYIDRIPNWVLMAIGVCGGAAGMLLAMKVLHHKTRYKRFMIGLPILIVLHVLAFIWVRYSSFIVLVMEASSME